MLLNLKCPRSRNTKSSEIRTNGKLENGSGEDYQKIKVHLVFDVKHDGRHQKDWLLMDTLPRNQWRKFIELNQLEQTSEIHT